MRVAAYCRIHDPSLSPSGRDDVLLSRLGPITTLHREPKTDPNWPTELHGMGWMSTPRNTMPETKSEKCDWTKFPAFSYIGGLSPDVVAIGFNQIVIIISLPELVLGQPSFCSSHRSNGNRFVLHRSLRHGSCCAAEGEG